MRAAKLAVLLSVFCLCALPAAAALKPFVSEAALQNYLKRLKHEAAKPKKAQAGNGQVESVVVTGSKIPEVGLYSSAPVAAVSQQEVKYEGTTNVGPLLNNLPGVFADFGTAPGSITNNQEALVDEGDIVKLHRDTLVILRRGRLFTVSLADGEAKPVDSIAAYPPGVDARDDWYDEMLIAGDRIVVIGFSYGRGGTEINRFHIDSSGHLLFEDAYQLRSNDYYSSRNYASRLIGHRLVLYMPQYIGWQDPVAALPALRRWNGSESKFRRIGAARRFYAPPRLKNDQIHALHTIAVCDVAGDVLDCDTTSLFGPEGRSFYVSPHAVYVWVQPQWNGCWSRKKEACLVYRLPLDGSAPSALGVRGSPEDQFSFREDTSNRELDVLVQSEGDGDGMWGPEDSHGSVSLLRIPVAAFRDGMRELDRTQYRRLPSFHVDWNYAFQNRFVGDYVLYGPGNGWEDLKNVRAELTVAKVRGDSWSSFPLPHSIDRIEMMGPNAVVVGGDAHDLMFSSVLLSSVPSLGDRYVIKDTGQSETRSHGFFFQPERGDPASGVVGLPITQPARPAYRQLFDESAAVTFLRYRSGRFSGLGELTSHPEGAKDDHCVASCVDWYGNARPVFLGNRVLALMGYELVDGRLDADAIRETGRADFAPK